jgi:hypothetical protein
MCWNLSYRSDRYCTPVRPIWTIQEQVWSTGLARSLYQLSEPFAGHVRYWTRLARQTIWPLEFELHRTSPAIIGHVRLLTQICQFREFSSESDLSPVGVTLLVWPVGWTDLTSWVWQPQRLVFQILYKRHSTPTLGGYWFLTIFITFWQSLELSPISFCEIQALGARFLSWVERFVLWVLILSLEHFELRQTLVKHLLLLEVKPPRRLGVALELPSVWWVLEKFVNVRFTTGRKEVRA